MTAPVLPPPTALDLAVIRARVDGRGWLGYPGAVRWDRLAGLVTVVVAIMLVSFGVDIFSDTGDDTAPAVLGAAVLALVNVCVGGMALLTSRRIDDAVRARLTPVTGGDAGRRRPGPAVWCIAAVPAAATGVSAAVAVDLLVRRPGWVSAVALLVPLLLGGLVVVAVREVIGTPAIGDGAVLRAVDAALARQDLGTPLMTVLPIATARWLVHGERWTGAPSWFWADIVLTVLFVLGLGVNGWVTSSARPLVQDWRLHHATPPQAWLAGAPPSPDVLRESPL
ncbi:hypothetical protein [Kineosporia sp. A_224]|uniref:hypothetical protein n=1 Tax=Kineosporia sp. A_224 TaxID=1962180 RepID=UPI000B4AAD8C|nr:hypothetical protein [Kineosporia sp. A_224]